jgi:uncharacterized protein YggU (UPF0235/DUF167 family)
VKVFVKAKISKTTGVERIDERHFVVSVKERPVQGRANEAIVMAMAEHLAVSRRFVRIISGHTSRQKILEIED